MISVGDSIRQSAFFKILVIGFLVMLLLIPLIMISSAVYERQSRYYSVKSEIGELFGYDQTIMGPVVTVPYQRFWKDDKDKVHTDLHYAYFLPENLQIRGQLVPETRYRGIYEVVVYRTDLTVSGAFEPPNFGFWKTIQPEHILWDDAYLTIGISDTRGIREALTLNWNKKELPFLSGTRSSLFDKGLHVRLPDLEQLNTTNYEFSFKLNLNGHEQLAFSPVGKETIVELSSSWQDPSFAGSFLPVERVINETGFEARWQVSHLGRSYPQMWNTEMQDSVNLHQEQFNVNLRLPVDFYQKVERSIKYGILFILLTFTTFFLFEIFNPIRIHPLQYLMVGFALSIFYLLLLSISEHLNFSWAYLIASGATIGLIITYGQWVLQSRQRSLIMGGFLVGLYIYLYVLLHLQDYALLFGAIGLFVILALVMFITRRVDWYALHLNQQR
ncbi:cell envelope integrity protein CreD [Thioflexithrix psekupsensis]|uniref:Cell envelope integrity protein CreD n=1 Tax=Thioflexithrix psekupsensis TaxID=1570016 RepID=A0A251XBX8_9GAMM|nr:cell envelope integrity protein CreD [Thioflexithrix psekupsensis]OUD16237.1 cell envelope integrity protein CreD [Thioflexithrix psekupsensis]